MAPTEAATTSGQAVTTPAHSVVASAMIPKIEEPHKDYLTIFSQTINLMSNIFHPSKRFHSDNII